MPFVTGWTGENHFASVPTALYGAVLMMGRSGVPLAFVHKLLSDAIYVFVALMWLIPDRRIEALFNETT